MLFQIIQLLSIDRRSKNLPKNLIICLFVQLFYGEEIISKPLFYKETQHFQNGTVIQHN